MEYCRYHFVSKAVAPKRAALKQATEELAETQKVLDAANAKLHEVEQGIATLQEKFTQCEWILFYAFIMWQMEICKSAVRI